MPGYCDDPTVRSSACDTQQRLPTPRMPLTDAWARGCSSRDARMRPHALKHGRKLTAQVRPGSRTATFCTAVLRINNARWHGATPRCMHACMRCMHACGACAHACGACAHACGACAPWVRMGLGLCARGWRYAAPACATSFATSWTRGFRRATHVANARPGTWRRRAVHSEGRKGS